MKRYSTIVAAAWLLSMATAQAQTAAVRLDAARAQRAAAESRHADAVAVTSAGSPEPDMEPAYAADEGYAPPMAGDALADRAGCASCTVGADRPTPRSLLVIPLLAVAVAWRVRRRRR